MRATLSALASFNEDERMILLKYGTTHCKHALWLLQAANTDIHTCHLPAQQYNTTSLI